MHLLSRLTRKTPRIRRETRNEDYGGETLMSVHRAAGIDVSNHNPNFPWHLWNGHIDFASAKATEGLTYQDPWFRWNWEGMKAIGVFRFAYHYAHPNLDPVKQAHYLVDYVK